MMPKCIWSVLGGVGHTCRGSMAKTGGDFGDIILCVPYVRCSAGPARSSLEKVMSS